MLTYKCTRSNGTDFRTGKIDYAEALYKNIAVEHETEPANGDVCGVGLHVSLTAKQTIQFADQSMRPWRWFEGEVNTEDIVEQDKHKLRVSKFKPTKEIYLEDIFGKDIAKRIEQVKVEIDTWKDIPWLKPKPDLKHEYVIDLTQQFINNLQPYATTILPKNVKIVNNIDAAVVIADAVTAVADAVADAAVAVAAAAAYEVAAAVAVAAAAVDAADAAVAAAAVADAVDASDAADAAADAAAVAYDAVADAATAYDVYVDAADAADAVAAAVDTVGFKWYWLRWYVCPSYVLRGHAYWQIAVMTETSPFASLVELFKLGCMPIGYVNNEFVIYVPN